MKEKTKKVKIHREQFDLYLEINKTNYPIKVNSRIKAELIDSSPFIKRNNDKIIIKNTFFEKSLLVKNVYRYSLKKNKDNFELCVFDNSHEDFKTSKFNDYPIDESSISPSIVIILESPHKDEYDNKIDCLSPIAPAQGTTGDLIFKKFVQIIRNSAEILRLLDKNEYRVLLVNPIPYQTSLYFLHKQNLKSVYSTLRDKVWIEQWERNEIHKTLFNNVLNKIKPSLILNCCTSKLTGYVSEEIKKTEFNAFQIHHPSSWWKELYKINIVKIN